MFFGRLLGCFAWAVASRHTAGIGLDTTNSDTDRHADANTDTDADKNTYACADANTQTDTNADASTDVNIVTEPDTYANRYTHDKDTDSYR